MRNINKNLIRSLAVAALILLALPYVAFAQSTPVTSTAPSTAPDQGFICKLIVNANDTTNDLLGTCVRRIYNFALGISGLIAMGVLVVAGYYYMTAGGDGEQVSHAKEMIGGAISGIIILSTAYIILQFLDPRLVNLRDDPTLPSFPSQPSQSSSGSSTSSTPAITVAVNEPDPNDQVFRTMFFQGQVTKPATRSLEGGAYAIYSGTSTTTNNPVSRCDIPTANVTSGNYSCQFNTATLADGTYTVVFGVLSSGVQFFSQPVTFRIDN